MFHLVDGITTGSLEDQKKVTV